MSEAQLTKRLYTAYAIGVGGRGGHTRNSDGVVDVELSVPKSMGGPGKAGTTTPEDLFAAGYAACFGSACEYVAKSVLKLQLSKLEVHSSVTIGQTVPSGFGLEVTLTVHAAGIDRDDANELVQTAHRICPYSNAIRGNVKVTLDFNVED